MHSPPLPLTRDLVLVGGGHTHALLLRKWGMTPLAGARVTVINPGPTAPYSGMLPGYVAGHYDRWELDIDLVKLARFADARVILGAVEGIDTDSHQVHVSGHPPVGFDVASVNVGITSDMPALPGFAEHAIPAKPLGRFAARWADYLNHDGPASVAVIGGGVAGAELVMAMAHALKAKGRAARITLIDNASILAATKPKAEATIRRAMQDLGVEVIENAVITRIAADHVQLQDGRAIPAHFVTGAAGARPYDWIARTGLDLQDGYIRVNSYLQSSDPAVFAAGDCAHLSENPRPKAGVYAVREAPVLFDNLRAALSAGRMRRYVPQKDYLKLISLGGKSALGERLGTSLSGPIMWKWKNHIDQTFMNRFRDLPQMKLSALPHDRAFGLDKALGEKPMCGGCGAKVGRDALQTALKSQPAPDRSDIIPLPGDDAALLQTGGVQQVMTSDHLRAFTNDPVLMARIAAVHALGDIWAMGAAPQAATATIILPRMSASLQGRTMSEIMAVAGDVMREAGAEVVGGHSSMGDEMTIGFTITGLCETPPITLSGGQPGDRLILTKPLGSGVLMAAEMAGLADGAWVAAAYQHMTQSQGKASRILAKAHAMTDVTGFGLAGHLHGICDASNCGAVLDLNAVEVMDGALTLTDQGVRSTIFADNRVIAMDLPAEGKAALLFDPQTAGGLLAAVDPSVADALIKDLKAAGYPAVIIGELTETPGLRLQS
ncbi:selenide, water dikinase SelD [Ruegeria sp. HKCCD7318]|uniref:selenide, water dikinase SelD n=1 Tax=Ruegeria sp. HKCCD7318 TaxID=2683014 RepID=UPI0014921CB1|nr:selenide, water dikinase SelD [Ruegeria sp. HKCCD7318]NOE33409.1 selenide, water dikinase SelD [Ruegeria sp. HKCCD7318]